MLKQLGFKAIRNGFVAIGLLAIVTAPALPSAASSSTSGTEVSDAITWAVNHNHQAIYDQQCLAFVAKAYAEGGVDIGSIGESNGAAQYWATNPKNYAEHPNNADPPVGALVFWGPTPAPWSNPYGHVGIYLGNDTVISSVSWPENSTQGEVHEFSFSGRNAASDGMAPYTPGFYPYLGWIAPTANSISTPVTTTPTLGADWSGNGGGFGQVRPPLLSNGGDPSGVVYAITWHSWGGSTADGVGTAEYVAPNQAVASGSQKPATIIAFNLGKCNGKSAYTAVEWYFPDEGQTFESDQYENACNVLDTPKFIPSKSNVGQWPSPSLVISPQALGTVKAGMTLTGAMRAAGIAIVVSGDGAYTAMQPAGYPYLYVELGPGGKVSCFGASGISRFQSIVTPEGFRLGETLSQLKSKYGRKLRYIPAPTTGGMTDFAGYVVTESTGNLAFNLNLSGRVIHITGGRGVGPNGCTG